MKLAKKMLACAMALAMVAALALTAFAAPEITMDSASAKVGEEVTITVAAKDIVGVVAAGDLVFTYDAEALEFVKVKKAYDEFDLTAQGNPEAGKVTFSFAFAEAATEDVALCTITFKVLKAGASAVTMELKSLSDPNENSVELAKLPSATVTGLEETTAAPTTIAPTTAAPTTAAPVEDESAPVSTTAADKIPQTGDVGVAAIAGVMALAAVAFVATRKKDAE